MYSESTLPKARSTESNNDWNKKMADFENEYSNVTNESQRLFNRTPVISGKENVPLDSAVKSARKQKNAASRAQDMQFVADIGQELLLECRKLQLLIAEKDEKLKESDSLRSQLEATIENLEVRVRHLDESEYRYKEENWNLELKIQELESESSETSHRLSKLNLENSRTLQMYTAQVDALESMQARHSELTSDLDSWKSKHESEMLNYEQLIANLQRDNEALSKSVANLNEQLASQVYVEPNDEAIKERYDEPQEAEEGGLSEDPKTPERSPPMSPVKATPAHRAALEGETLRASLGHAHRAISTLRGALYREKTEKLELRRLLAEVQEEMECLKNSKSSKRAKVSSAQSTKRTTLLGNNGRRSQYRISNDLDEMEGDIEWETFNGSNEAFASANEISASETDGFETAHDQPTSEEEAFSDRTETEAYQTVAESIPDTGPSDDDDDTETESSAVNTGVSRQRSAISGSDITDDDDEVMGSRILRSKLSRRNLYQKRDSDNFGTPMPLFDELGSSPFGGTHATPTKTKVDVRDAGAMTDPWAPEIVYIEREITTESVMAGAAALSMVTISKDDYNSLVNRKATPPNTISADAESASLAFLGKDEHDSLTNRKESAAADAESLSLVTLSRPEYESALNRKAMQSLEAGTAALSMVIHPEDEYESPSKPSPAAAASVTADAAGPAAISNTRADGNGDEYESLARLPPHAAASLTDAGSAFPVSVSNTPADGKGDEYESLSRPPLATATSLTAAVVGRDVPVALSNTLADGNRDEYESLSRLPPAAAAGPAISVAISSTPADNKTMLGSFKYEDDEQSRAEHGPGEPVVSSDNFSRRSVPIAPLMLQAITQTMIGEYLWKYTRRKGRQTLSENRHKRYFWVHPYTRTLYWSDKNPSAGGEIKAKSAPIEGVRVAHDDNPFPPGLYHKSLVILTPSRTLQVTCLTQERHETWFSALSFLLLRTNTIPRVTVRQGGNVTEESQVSAISGSLRSGQELINTLGNSQPANTLQFGTNVSISSYNSRTTSSAPPRIHNTFKQPFRVVDQGSMGRWTSLFRPSTGSLRQRSKNESQQAPIGIYEAQEAIDSTDELQAQMEREVHEMGGLENVRVCCDGKHDVSTLHRASHHHK
ncbi:meiotic cell cortex C-terminal pleckstrin homology-domain-containing protein [Lipomyces doorenjongii]|uniref:meiotic cell cortex C-terminal pleckstrin homology-domain-containing protein n=1 Tax=Lipomyces doorenjongii TaxID=383834 RepID=UPI0034CF73D7